MGQLPTLDSDYLGRQDPLQIVGVEGMLIEARRESIFIDLDHQSHGKTEPMNSRIQQGQGLACSLSCTRR